MISLGDYLAGISNEDHLKNITFDGFEKRKGFKTFS